VFERWEKTGTVTVAGRKAHVNRQTFYNGKGRFEAGGYAALASHAPKQPRRVSAAIEPQPGWGKQRIADELVKGNSWVPLASPNTVKRFRQDAGRGSEAEATAKKGGRNPLPGAQKRPGNP